MSLPLALRLNSRPSSVRLQTRQIHTRKTYLLSGRYRYAGYSMHRYIVALELQYIQSRAGWLCTALVDAAVHLIKYPGNYL